ncbi:hypothetical protein LTR16_010570, partial [Cryomyces antarcticus]
LHPHRVPRRLDQRLPRHHPHTAKLHRRSRDADAAAIHPAPATARARSCLRAAPVAIDVVSSGLAHLRPRSRYHYRTLRPPHAPTRPTRRCAHHSAPEPPHAPPGRRGVLLRAYLQGRSVEQRAHGVFQRQGHGPLAFEQGGEGRAARASRVLGGRCSVSTRWRRDR